MAVGAHGRDVTTMIVEDSFKPIAGGAALGLLAAMAASKALRSFLFGVTANDPLTLALATTLLVGVGLAASWIPARRAARVDPMIAMKAD